MQEIANLAEQDLPPPGAGWEQINAFAHSFNGYGYSEKLHELGERARTTFEQRRALPEPVSELRACLFYEARRWRHYVYDPGEAAMEYIHALVEAIRHLVRAA